MAFLFPHKKPVYYARAVKAVRHIYLYLHKRSSIFVPLTPYAWLSLFFLLPFLLITQISFSKTTIGIPPFSPIFTWTDQAILNIQLNFATYKALFCDDLYISTFISSLNVAGVSAIICLLIGFMMAYGISRSPEKYKLLFLFLVILPFWTSFLIRVYAWMSMLSTKGAINQLLLFLHLIPEPLQLLDNTIAVCVGIVYCYLPFMVLPIYTSLEKIDPSLIEASFDLGASPFRTFWKITVPLSSSGLIAGFILVFVPAVGEFVIPELLGGADTLMIGRTLWLEFFNNRDWPQACALAVSLVVLVVAPLMIFQFQQSKKEHKIR